MELSNLSRHGIIIAVVVALGGVVSLLTEISLLKMMWENKETYGYTLAFLALHIVFLQLSLVAIIISAQLIWAIIKKHLKVLKIWLVIMTSAFLMYDLVVASNSILGGFNCQELLNNLLIVGVQTTFIYPIYCLWKEMSPPTPKAEQPKMKRVPIIPF